MLAIAIFAFILLIVSQGLLHIVKQQQNAQITSRAEQNVRSLLDQISREARGASEIRSTYHNLCLKMPSGWIFYYTNWWDSPSVVSLRRQELPYAIIAPNTRECPITYTGGEVVSSLDISILRLKVATTPAL